MADISEGNPVFRATKRRKVFRTRIDTDDDIPTSTTSDTTTRSAATRLADNEVSVGEANRDDTDGSVVDFVRQRRLLKARRQGIAFTQEQLKAADRQSISQELVPVEAPSASATAVGRFAAETGQRTVSDDNVMIAYIDSEMAKARAGQSQTPFPSTSASVHENNPQGVMQRHPAAVGKLMEIDLGQEATLKNEARTRRLLDGLPEEEETKIQRVRLGRDGKPRRKRWRRPSEDLKRDALVDAVLKESNLDKYDTSEQTIATGNDEAADEVIAERFRQEYMEAAQNKLAMQRKPASTTATKGKVDDKLKGPKLGGSRSTRAAYHAQEKAAAGKK